MMNLNEENFENYPCDNYAVQMLQKCLGELNPTSLSLYKKKLLIKNEIDTKLLKRKGAIKQNREFIKELVDKFPEGLDDQKELLAALYSIPQDDSLETTHWLKSIISQTNNYRLDGVWSRNMIETLLSLGLMISPHLASLCVCVSLINGVAGYGFYFVRGGLDILKLGSHTLEDNPAYGNISTYTKLKVQWEMRYSSIINDVPLWGVVNFLTFHIMDSFVGNITTAVLLLADLVHTLFQQYMETCYFEKLKEELKDNEFAIRKLEELHQRQMLNYNLVILYQAFLLLSFITLCSFFAATASVPLMLIGAGGCLVLQLGINLKDHFIKLSYEEDEVQRSVVLFKMISRLVLQLLLPSMFILSAFYLMPLIANAVFMTAALLAVSAMLINLMNNLNELYEAYKTQPKPGDLAKIDTEIKGLSSVEDEETSNLNRFKLEKITALQDKKTSLQNRFDVALSNLTRESLYSLSGIGLITMVGIALSCGLTPCLGIIALASVLTFAAGYNYEPTLSTQPLII